MTKVQSAKCKVQSKVQRGFTLRRTLLRKNLVRAQHGFTLIELLVVISVIGIILALTIIGLQGARTSSRDARRKADLELVRSGLEIYRADCYSYPLSLGSSLVGDDSGASCLSSNTYISEMPTGPIPARSYYYNSDGLIYELCAALEGSGSDTCSGSCGETCNYKTINP